MPPQVLVGWLVGRLGFGWLDFFWGERWQSFVDGKGALLPVVIYQQT